MYKKLLVLSLLLVALLIAAPVYFAQSGGGIDLSWHVLSGGGASNSTGGGVSLGGSAGQFGAGASTGGGVSLLGGFWRCAVAAVAPDDVAAALSGVADAQLTWTGSGVYDIWQSPAPYFQPGDPGSQPIGLGQTPPFTATGVVGNPAANAYFVVLNVDACVPSGPSNRTAAFTFAVTPGTP